MLLGALPDSVLAETDITWGPLSVRVGVPKNFVD